MLRGQPASRLGSAGGRPVAVDLFSGAGGFSLGFEQAGFDILASAEYDPIHCAVHAFNFPRTEIVCEDIRMIDAKKIRTAVEQGWKRHRRPGQWDGQLDVIVGGPPCQGFSTMGKRQLDDIRNQLVFSFARLVGELKPRHFVLENVPGMLSLATGPGPSAPKLIDVLVGEFEGYGYNVAPPTMLNAAEFGVPQQRRRLIVIGSRKGCKRPAFPIKETTARPRRPEQATAPAGHALHCPTVWDAIGDLPNVDRNRILRFSDEVELTQRALDKMHSAASLYARTLIGLDKESEDYSYRRAWDRTTLTSSLRTAHTHWVAKRFAGTPQGHPEPVSRLFRLHPSGVSSTLRAGTHYERGSFNAPRPIHPTFPRVISVREAARLHSFPDWFRLHWTKWHGFRQVGNAIPPRLGRAIGREIMRTLGAQPEKPKRSIKLGDPKLLFLENLEAAAHFNAPLDRIPRSELRRRSPSLP